MSHFNPNDFEFCIGRSFTKSYKFKLYRTRKIFSSHCCGQFNFDDLFLLRSFNQSLGLWSITIFSCIKKSSDRSFSSIYLFSRFFSIEQILRTDFHIDSAFGLYGYSQIPCRDVQVEENHFEIFWKSNEFSEIHLSHEERPFLTLWSAIKMFNMFFIFRLIRFLPASKNIQIIVGTVIDEIRNGGAFFGVLFVSWDIRMSRSFFIQVLNDFYIEFLLCIFDSWNGTFSRCNDSSLWILQSIKSNVRAKMKKFVKSIELFLFVEFVEHTNS